MIELINTIPGIILNAFLLYLIKRFSRKDLGAYKYLLATFAVYDVFLIIMHAIVNVSAVVTDKLYGVMSTNFPEALEAISLYGSFFMVPFSLLNIHFLYRYWVIRFPFRVALFTRFRFIMFLVVGVVCITSIWFCICEFGIDTNEPGYYGARLALAVQLNRSHVDGWFLFQHKGEMSVRTVLNLLAFDVIMLIMLMTSVVLASLTFIQIRKEKSLSTSDRHSQLRILFILCVQTIVPFIFVYSPYLMLFNLPLLGFRTPSFAAAITPFVHSIFPMLDALVVILLMKDYRNGARSLIVCREEQVWPSMTQPSRAAHPHAYETEPYPEDARTMQSCHTQASSYNKY